MKIIAAFDSYKGCITSQQAAQAAQEGILQLCRERGSSAPEFIALPIADGGEGMMEAIVISRKGEIHSATVHDPLGREISARYGIVDGTAVIECAEAIGLPLIEPELLNPLEASSCGLGELIMAAYDSGCRRFLIGLGGSATNDGGMGMIDCPGFLETVRGCEFILACDVDNPYTGPNGATRTFGPQKGATPEMLEILENRLCGYAKRIYEETGVDLIGGIPGTGAAGGLGGAFLAYLGARLMPGIEMVLDAVGFDAIAADADLVITGEGRSDAQTLHGKTACGILRRVQKLNSLRTDGKASDVVLISGAILDAEVLREGGFRSIAAATPPGTPLSEAMIPENAIRNVARATKEVLATLGL